MLGTIRFTLATLVMLNHLVPPFSGLGAHAVISFYVLSGYLMTKVIHEVYGLTLTGGIRYLANRFLRIFPPYFAVLVPSLALLLLFPGTFGKTYSIMIFPQTPWEFFSNVSLVYLPSSPSIVVPPAWSLSVEFFFYVAMILFLAHSRLIVTIWFLLSLAYTIWLIWIGAKFGDRYTPVQAASVFFSAGAMIYFWQDRLVSFAPKVSSAWVLFALFAVLPLIVDAAGLRYGMVGFYGAGILFVFVLLTAVQHLKSGDIDRLLGDLAYPVFILHFFASGLMRMVAPAEYPLRGVFLIMAIPLTLALSYAMVLVSRQTIDKIRTEVRSGRMPLTPASRPDAANL